MTVLELLSDPKRWTQDAFARDSTGFKCDVDAPDAQCFCLLGAIYKCYGTWPSQTAFEPIREKINKSPTWQKFEYSSTAQFNDHVDYETLVQMLKEANI